ncbi:MAG TPA: nucleotidyl transferase AbiEii/AbiGii toxin family protein [Cyclobacteriaceae bacterium]|nr:nucleotidyl transferase AbiEii/AbiGii toxin family protein [Cyclobacteriaceae bacterium]
MADDFHWNTVKASLKETLTVLMSGDAFTPFRLVGGTCLSLQLGHRMSDDIDLFTDAPYETIDFISIDKFLRKNFPYVSDLVAGPVGLGTSYLVGDNKDTAVKLDLYHTDSFIQEPLNNGIYRLATIEEVIAMKVDIIQRKARKKDFWDLHELIESYTLTKMMSLHSRRYPHNHDRRVIRRNFTDFSRADDDFNPICLRGKHWELIKLDFVEFMKN